MSDRILLTCPGCGEEGYIDDDQFHGRVSVHHDEPHCGYHETVDWSKVDDPRVRVES